MQNRLQPFNLRERADLLLRQSPRDISRLSGTDIQALVQELQVHQIELEMQNEELHRTQQELQESCDRFADLYDFAPVGYLTIDAQKKIVEANLTLTTMLGIERGKLIGRKLSDFIAPEEQDKFYLHCRQLFDGDDAGSDQTRDNPYSSKKTCILAMRKLCGTPIYCRLECAMRRTVALAEGNASTDALRGANTPGLLCRMALIDITEWVLAEQARQESEAKLKIVAEMVPDILYLCDAQGWREYVNPQFYLFTGMPEGKGKGNGWQEAVHPDDLPQLLSDRFAAAKCGEPWEGKFRLRSATGDYHWFISRARLLQKTNSNGNSEKWLCSDTDIDQLVRSEQALIEADHRKDEFLAMLAHELRNPLAPIRTTAYLLSAENLDAERLFKVRDILERNVVHMVRMIDDLLDVSRITSGTITLKKDCVELAAIIQEAIETAQPLITAKKHHLHVELPQRSVHLYGDAARLTQIFTNILNNSAKYTPEGGRIDFQAVTEGAFACVRIRDNGMGIPVELLSHVFDIFRQDERGLDRAQGGLGIGLTLVKRLVELHGGDIAAFSDGHNRGAEFVVRLPILVTPGG